MAIYFAYIVVCIATILRYAQNLAMTANVNSINDRISPPQWRGLLIPQVNHHCENLQLCKK
ncbi:hypothetical protein [Helicobacter sp. T3_23-1056]